MPANWAYFGMSTWYRYWSSFRNARSQLPSYANQTTTIDSSTPISSAPARIAVIDTRDDVFGHLVPLPSAPGDQHFAQELFLVLWMLDIGVGLRTGALPA
jgi:hypothetical protein